MIAQAKNSLGSLGNSTIDISLGSNNDTSDLDVSLDPLRQAYITADSLGSSHGAESTIVELAALLLQEDERRCKATACNVGEAGGAGEAWGCAEEHFWGWLARRVV